MGYFFGNEFYGIGFVGLCPAYLISTATKFPDRTGGKNNKKIVNRFDFGGQITLGCGYKLTQKFEVFSEMILHRSITKIDNPKYFYKCDIKHYGILTMIGTRYKLNKR